MKAAAILASILIVSTGGLSAAPQVSDAAPLSIGVVLDTSGSMGSKMALARGILSQLIEGAQSKDELALVEASDRPVLLKGFGNDADALLAYASPSEAKGGSALMDALYLGVQVTGTGSNQRKALVLISDGGDNGSSRTRAEIEEAVGDTGVRVFVITLSEANPTRDQLAHEFAASLLLTQIAEAAGGREFAVQNASELTLIAAELGDAMRSTTP